MSEENSSFLDNCLNAVEPTANFVGHTTAGIDAIDDAGKFVASTAGPAAVVMRVVPETAIAIGPYLIYEGIKEGGSIAEQYATNAAVSTENARANLDIGCFAMDILRENAMQTAVDVSARIDRMDQFVNSVLNTFGTDSNIHIDPVESNVGIDDCGTGQNTKTDTDSNN